MAFRVPSLSESRQKQDELNRSNAASKARLSTTATNRCVSSSTPPPTTTTEGGGGGGARRVGGSGTDKRKTENGFKSGITRTAVKNPYARKKARNSSDVNTDTRQPQTLLSNKPQTATVGTKASSVTTPYAQRTNNNSGSVRSSSLPKIPPDGPREIIDTKTTSFSQAFDAVEETCHYDAELSVLKKNNESTAARTVIHIDRDHTADTTTTTTTITSTGESPTTDKRSHHALLQPHVLHISTRQRGNPLLKHLRNVPYAFSKIIPDYIFSPNRCALFLSCRYHNLHPTYVHTRLAELGSDFDLRILLCLVDVEDVNATLLFLNKLCVVNDASLVLAWSELEAARYLETFKAYEGKDASSIQKRKKETTEEQIMDVLGCVRSVNKTDAVRLVEQFGSLGEVVKADLGELGNCVGIGDKKAKRLWEAFHKPFSKSLVERNRKAQEEAERVVKLMEDENGGDGGGDGDNHIGMDDDCDNDEEENVANHDEGNGGDGNDNYEVEVLSTHDLTDDAQNDENKNKDISSAVLDVGATAQV